MKESKGLSEPNWLNQRCRDSALFELHLCAGQLQAVAVFEWYGRGAYGRAVQHGHIRAFHVRQHKSLVALGDRSHGHARLADGGDHFLQRHFSPRGCA